MPHTLRMCAMPMWIEINIVKIGGSTGTHLPNKITLFHRRDPWRLEVPRNWIFFVTPYTKRDIYRLGEINSKTLLIVFYCGVHYLLSFPIIITLGVTTIIYLHPPRTTPLQVRH
jgi:hypothetical protein